MLRPRGRTIRPIDGGAALTVRFAEALRDREHNEQAPITLDLS